MKKNNAWNITRLVDESFVPANQHIILKIVRFKDSIITLSCNVSPYRWKSSIFHFGLVNHGWISHILYVNYKDRLLISNFHFCYRELLKEIKKAGEIHIVLDCSTEKIQSILTHASQVGMMTAYHNYLITSLVRNDTFLTLRGIHLYHFFFIFPFIYISIQ